MNARKARALRRLVYGEEKSFRARKYSYAPIRNLVGMGTELYPSTTILADKDRRAYRALKKVRVK